MILKRYVLKTFLSFYPLVAVAFVAIFLIGDFFERVDEFIGRGAPLHLTLTYYFYKIPFVIFYVAPQAVLLATVLSVSSLARSNQITAMKACGVSVTRITLPIIGASVIIALLVLASGEFISPETSRRMNDIFYVQVRKGTDVKYMENKKIWRRSKNGLIWNAESYDPKSLRLSKITLFVTENNRFIRKRINAEYGIWVDGHWEFMDGLVRSFGPEGLESTKFFERKSLNLPEVPSDFILHRKRPEELSVRDMYREIMGRRSSGKDAVDKWMEFNYRLSYPFIGVVLALIGIPLSLRSSRHGGLFFSVAVNLAIGVSFSFFYTMCLSLGRGGTFDPVMAAWGPIALFTSIGFYLLLTIDSDKPLPFLK